MKRLPFYLFHDTLYEFGWVLLIQFETFIPCLKDVGTISVGSTS